MKPFTRALLVWLLLIPAFTTAFIWLGSGLEASEWLNALIKHFIFSAVLTLPVALLVLLFGLRGAQKERSRQITQAVIEEPIPSGPVVFQYLSNSRSILLYLLCLVPLELGLGFSAFENLMYREGDVAEGFLLALLFCALLPVIWSFLVMFKAILLGGLPITVGDDHIEAPVLKCLRFEMVRLPLSELTFAGINSSRKGWRILEFGDKSRSCKIVEMVFNEMDFMRLYVLIHKRATELKKQQQKRSNEQLSVGKRVMENPDGRH